MSRREPSTSVGRSREGTRAILATARSAMWSVVRSVVPEAQLYGRIKRGSSARQKKSRTGEPVALDAVGLRVIVREEAQCYRVVAEVHRRFEFLVDKYDDYITSPKPNGYRSLHTTIRLPGGHPVELQVRSRAMHAVAEHGSAAHWLYKRLQLESADGAPTADGHPAATAIEAFKNADVPDRRP